VYVANEFNDRIQKFDSNGNFITEFGQDRLGHPIDVAIDSQARVYASDENNGQILIYALANQIPTPPPDSDCTIPGNSNILITGTNGPDTLIGNTGNNLMNGLGENDRMNGCSGSESVNGNTGNDGIAGGTEWFGWRSLGGEITSNIESAINKDGRVEIFARGTDDLVLHNTQKSGGISHDWSGWKSLGGRITLDIKAEKNVDGRVEIFARGEDSAVWHIAQSSAGME
jgi:Ca2+-binding RTX toxin-like protein